MIRMNKDSQTMRRFVILGFAVCFSVAGVKAGSDPAEPMPTQTSDELTEEELITILQPGKMITRDDAVRAKALVVGKRPGAAEYIDITEQGMGASVDIRFLVNRADILETERPKLDRIGRLLEGTVAGETYEVLGHASSEGPFEWNNTLSRMRAESMRSYLVANYRIAATLTVVAKGITEPVRNANGVENRERSRRAQIKKYFSR